MTIEAILAIYVVGVVVTAVGIGALHPDDEQLTPLALIWPFLLVAGAWMVAVGVVSWLALIGPHKLGKYLRSKTHG